MVCIEEHVFNICYFNTVMPQYRVHRNKSHDFCFLVRIVVFSFYLSMTGTNSRKFGLPIPITTICFCLVFDAEVLYLTTIAALSKSDYVVTQKTLSWPFYSSLYSAILPHRSYRMTRYPFMYLIFFAALSSFHSV